MSTPRCWKIHGILEIIDTRQRPPELQNAGVLDIFAIAETTSLSLPMSQEHDDSLSE